MRREREICRGEVSVHKWRDDPRVSYGLQCFDMGDLVPCQGPFFFTYKKSEMGIHHSKRQPQVQVEVECEKLLFGRGKGDFEEKEK